MAIAFVSGQYTDGGTTKHTSLAAVAPPGLVAGNLLVAVCLGYIPPVTPPSGWALAPSGSSPGGAVPVYVFTKTATASEPASYTFTQGGLSFFFIALVQFSGTTGLDKDCHFNSVSSGPSNPVSAPDVDPTTGNMADYWVTAYPNAIGSAFTTPAGASVALWGGTFGYGGIAMFYQPLTSDADIGPQQSNMTDLQAYTGTSLLLLPAAGPVIVTGTASVALGPLVVGSSGSVIVTGTAVAALGPLVVAVTNAGVPVFIYVGWIPHTNATGQPP